MLRCSNRTTQVAKEDKSTVFNEVRFTCLVFWHQLFVRELESERKTDRPTVLGRWNHISCGASLFRRITLTTLLACVFLAV